LILSTGHQGTVWRPEYSRTVNSLYGLAVSPIGICCAVGRYGTILIRSARRPRRSTWD
jgi:hypothetical protein